MIIIHKKTSRNHTKRESDLFMQENCRKAYKNVKIQVQEESNDTIIFTCSLSGFSKVASLSRSRTSHCRFAPQLCPGSSLNRVLWSKSGRVLVGASFKQVAQLKQWATPLYDSLLIFSSVFLSHHFTFSTYVSYPTSTTVFMTCIREYSICSFLWRSDYSHP